MQLPKTQNCDDTYVGTLCIVKNVCKKSTQRNFSHLALKINYKTLYISNLIKKLKFKYH